MKLATMNPTKMTKVLKANPHLNPHLNPYLNPLNTRNTLYKKNHSPDYQQRRRNRRMIMILIKSGWAKPEIRHPNHANAKVEPRVAVAVGVTVAVGEVAVNRYRFRFRS